jgi:hypothetical protein
MRHRSSVRAFVDHCLRRGIRCTKVQLPWRPAPQGAIMDPQESNPRVAVYLRYSEGNNAVSPNESKVLTSRRAPNCLEQLEFPGLCDRRRAIVNLQLAENLVHVPLGGTYGRPQLDGDFLIGEAPREQAKDLALCSAEGFG